LRREGRYGRQLPTSNSQLPRRVEEIQNHFSRGTPCHPYEFYPPAPDNYTYCISCYKFSSILYINSLHRSSGVERPLPGGENRRGGHRITRNCEALGSFSRTW